MKKIKEIFDNILGSFSTDKKGWSARKLAAFTVIILVIITHVKWYRSDRWEYLGEVLGFDFLFILTCLGLATWQSVKENGTKTENNS
jgi:hypothetical protein